MAGATYICGPGCCEGCGKCYGYGIGCHAKPCTCGSESPDSQGQSTCGPKCCASCSDSSAELHSCDREACACIPASPDSGSDSERVVNRVEKVYDDSQVSAREFLRDNTVPDSGEGDR